MNQPIFKPPGPFRPAAFDALPGVKKAMRTGMSSHAEFVRMACSAWHSRATGLQNLLAWIPLLIGSGPPR